MEQVITSCMELGLFLTTTVFVCYGSVVKKNIRWIFLNIPRKGILRLNKYTIQKIKY